MTGVAKAVIPAAGLGTRFLPLTKAQPKEMLPVLHKPVIQYVVEEAYQSGLREILIITGRGKRAIEDHFDRGNDTHHHETLQALDELLADVNLYFVRQKGVRGLGHAVGHAESFAAGEPFAVLLGDTITIPSCTRNLIEVYRDLNAPVIAVEEVPEDRVSHYGIVKGKEVQEGVLRITDLVEKPSPPDAPSRLAILGRYLLTPEIFACIRKTPPGVGGEIQLTDALRMLAQRSEMYSYLYRGRRFDIGNKRDWLKANIELALEDAEFSREIGAFLPEVLGRTRGK